MSEDRLPDGGLLGLGQHLMLTRAPAAWTGQQRVPATCRPPRPPGVHGPDRHLEERGDLCPVPALHQRGHRRQPHGLLRIRRPGSRVPHQITHTLSTSLNPKRFGSIAAVSYVGGYRRARGRRLVGLFAAMYFGGLRPAEAVGLAETDLNLSEQGWGSALLHRTRPSVGKQWTDSGETHDDRGLKNRPTEDVRRVPILPHLVAVLREHLATFGTADDGRLLFTEKGSVVPSSTYYRVWQEARLLALPPAVAASPLASRPYDLRHSALSTWLNAGVDPTEVAERAGNSVEVLLTRYAKCLDGRQDVANRRIEGLLREYD